MIMHLFLVALLAIAVAVCVAGVIAGPLNIIIPTLAQNVTSGNTTGGNSAESLITSEERGAYREYGG